MRKIDEIGLNLCKIQAELFERSASTQACSSLIFIRRFMNSQVAQRMDTGSFLFESCEINQIFDEINAQFGKSNYGKEKYNESELYWIGYIYRYWSYTQQKSSKQLYRSVKPKELRSLYYPYHSLDPSQAIERIEEAKNGDNEDMISKGVKILREIIKKSDGQFGQK